MLSAVTSDRLAYQDVSLSGSRSMRAARAADMVVGRLGVAKPIVFVSGFWRSGTTWMQKLLADSLGAKTVFEPLCPQNPIWRAHLLAAGVLDETLQEAFIPGRTGADGRMWPYLDAAFRAIATSPVSMKCRGRLQESFRSAIVVKDVRLQLHLAAIHQRYGIGIVHLRRHPCAVVSSLMTVRWKWNFDRVSMASLVAPFADELRVEGLAGENWARQFDADTVSRIAAYWAITERLTDRIVRHQPWATVLAYEDAVLEPERTVDDLCRLIGRRRTSVANPHLDSATTYGSSRRTPGRHRLHAWRNRMSASDIDRVYRVVDAIFPEALTDLRDGPT
jgi:hypothetical protein